jgi:hypothetical protein
MVTKVRPSLTVRALGAPEFRGSERKKNTIYRGVDSFLNPGAGISVRGITTPPEQLLLAPHHTESKS